MGLLPYKDWHPKSPSVDGWQNKLWDVQTMKLLAVPKGSKESYTVDEKIWVHTRECTAEEASEESTKQTLWVMATMLFSKYISLPLNFWPHTWGWVEGSHGHVCPLELWAAVSQDHLMDCTSPLPPVLWVPEPAMFKIIISLSRWRDWSTERLSHPKSHTDKKRTWMM